MTDQKWREWEESTRAEAERGRLAADIIPAAPGFDILCPILEKNRSCREYTTEPVIAWRIEAKTRVYPITVSEIITEAWGAAMRYPNGMIEGMQGALAGARFRSQIEWLQALNNLDSARRP